jgi:hypothetical protein
MRGHSGLRQHRVGASLRAALDELQHGDARIREQRSSVGSGPTDGPLRVEVCQAWLGQLALFQPNTDLE